MIQAKVMLYCQVSEHVVRKTGADTVITVCPSHIPKKRRFAAGGRKYFW